MEEQNRLVLVGNGFDLAHGLKTSYKNFMDWYMCEAFQQFYTNKGYQGNLIEITNKYSGMTTTFKEPPKTFEQVLDNISSSEYQSITYKSELFKRLVSQFRENNWVDIERYYFRMLKSYYNGSGFSEKEKKDVLRNLNNEFDFLIKSLTNYIKNVNAEIKTTPELKIGNTRYNLFKAFSRSDKSNVKFLNFNYTETLIRKAYADEENVIHIHGRVEDVDNNPIIFGYGDESDPVYQSIEDSGENVYLEHIKSFGYFQTDNYHKLLSYIDSAPYIVYIVGHSCGLSDRVLLSTIFENANCQNIEIFYHQRNDDSDNFKEITQEISRHFRPQNKAIMHKKLGSKNSRNIIPQNG